MRHVIRKAFWNYEKEERWLNEMAAKGLALVDYSWCRYAFEESRPGEYIIRIELLENLLTHPESTQYIRFMEENGAEQVAGYVRWVYFRKKSAEGAFDIYSDLASRMAHYRRVFRLWLGLAIFELGIGAFNIMLGISNYYRHFYHSLLNLSSVLGGITFVLGLGLLGLALHYRRKVARLKRDSALME